jgi:hypothetical protein
MGDEQRADGDDIARDRPFPIGTQKAQTLEAALHTAIARELVMFSLKIGSSGLVAGGPRSKDGSTCNVYLA